jgi:hypothetical protein
MGVIGAPNVFFDDDDDDEEFEELERDPNDP